METNMAKIDFQVDDTVAVVTLNSGENRFNPDFVTSYLDVLDEIENNTEAATLVVTSGHEKIFSNGIDLDWLLPIIAQKDTATSKSFFYLLNKMFKRTLTYPLLTIAAINGHAFAGGAIWSCAFDFRFMRSDRGFFCFPEADLKIPFLPGMLGLLKKAIPAQVMEEMVYTGLRLTADQCKEYMIAKDACPIEQLMETTMGFAKSLNKSRAYVKEMRHRMYKDIIHALEVEDVAYIESERLTVG
jgi:enoyl-CoA hydratase/carnithine racemase